MIEDLKDKIKIGGAVTVAVILILVAAYGASWILTCGVIKLITMCFGLSFKWSTATGIWLVLLVLETVFKSRGK